MKLLIISLIFLPLVLLGATVPPPVQHNPFTTNAPGTAVIGPVSFTNSSASDIAIDVPLGLIRSLDRANGRFNVLSFGAKGDGITDDTAAIQSAIDYGNSGSVIYLPGSYFSNRVYRITGALRMTHDVQVLEGDLDRASVINLTSPTNCSALILGGNADKTFQLVVRNLAITWPAGDGIQRTGIECYDISHSLIEDVQVASAAGVGVTNTGILTMGRDETLMQRISIQADIPFHIARNPNSYLDFDIINVDNSELLCTSSNQPCILIDDGVMISNSKLSNMSWALGKEGLRWVTTTAIYNTDAFILENIRREQSQDNTAYNIYIDHQCPITGSTLQNFVMRDFSTDLYQNGVYLRGVGPRGAAFYNTSFFQTGALANAGTNQWNFDATVWKADFYSCFSEQNANATNITTNGMIMVESSPATFAGAFPSTSSWVSTNNAPTPKYVHDLTVGNRTILGAQTFASDGFALSPLGIETLDFTNGVSGSRLQLNLSGSTGNQVGYLDSFMAGTTLGAPLALNANSGGNVSVGATNALEKFNIWGGKILQANTDFVFGVQGTATVISLNATSGNTYGRFDTWINGELGAGDIVLAGNGGNVGVDKAPTTRLDVNGTVNALGFSLNGSPGVASTTFTIQDHGLTNWTFIITGGLVTSITHTP